jgi:type I restriction enzyme, S subunit
VGVKEAYKQTEVGIIPKDWNISVLKELTKSVISGRSKSGNQIGTYPVYGSTGIIGYTEHPDYEGEAILVARVGANAGKINTVSGKYSVTDNTIIIIVKEDNSFSFLAQLLEIKKLNDLVFGSGQPLITGSQLKSLQFATPKIAEQKLITNTLNDVNLLIHSLDKLIKKKNKLKKTIQHQLLSGETRLPGFKDKWKTITLGDLGSTYGGLTGKTKSDFDRGEGRYITFMNLMINIEINCNTFGNVVISNEENQNKVESGDLIFNGSSETPEEVALCSIMTNEISDLYLNSFCFGFRFFKKNKVDGLFLAYYMRSNQGRKIIKILAQGSTRYNISKTALLKAEILIPSNKNEQVSISKVCSDIDAELTLLLERYNKTKKIKEAIMQELILGKTRLINQKKKNA